MIDVVSNWRQTTLGQYGRVLRHLARFEAWSGVPTLVPTPLERPPTGASFGLMYAQLQSTIPKPGRKGIKYSTSRMMRSAASMWYNLDFQQCFPEQAIRDQNQRCYLTTRSVPTDALALTFLNAGMARRMGDTSEPSNALVHEHIEYIDRRLEELYRAAPTLALQQELATAATANLLAWLAWLRGGELFGIGRDDVTVTPPALGPTIGLPANCGAIQARLAPETKSNPTRTADVVVAYRCGSGLSLGKWMSRLLSFPGGRSLFSTPNRTTWNSSYFRHTYVFPLLEELRVSGAASLRRYTNQEGHRIQDKMWSMHSYRRGGLSQVSRNRREYEEVAPGWRVATSNEIHEHGRWRTRYQSEAMSVHYREWELVDRVMITMLCM